MERFKLPMLGMRNVKTALSVMICLGIYTYTPLSGSPLTAAIAAVICLKPTVENSAQVAKERLIGTFAGGVVGLLGMYLLEFCGVQYGIVIIPVFIMLFIYLCTMFKINESIVIGCVVLLSILVMERPEGMEVYFYVYSRILETLIGIFVSLGINLAFFKIGELCHKLREKYKK